MTIQKQYDYLLRHKAQMRFNPPASESDIQRFEQNFGRPLPPQMKELLRLFDGGELFVPGTRVFGVGPENRKTLLEVNLQRERSISGIPGDYFVFARMNFGDLLCINSNPPYDVIQWDHEQNVEFYRYNSVCDWLNEEIAENETYEAETK